jgi:uncharacterized protein YijF (DUF1287 family)
MKLGALVLTGLCFVLAGCSTTPSAGPPVVHERVAPAASAPVPPANTLPSGSVRARRLATSAQGQVGRTVRYDPSYVEIAYPGGDVPIDRGVCTDVVIRAFRALHVDLQVAVHTDMAAHFGAYPRKWGLRTTNTSIDHRRVPNLQTYFRRRGCSVRITKRGADYLPGDLVTWSVSGLPHIGIISTVPAPDGSRYCVVHNIGRGTQVEDMLFDFPITGHYRPL